MTKTITMTMDAAQLRIVPSLIPVRLAEFAAGYMLPNAVGKYNPATQTATLTFADDTGNAATNKMAVAQIAREVRGWVMR